jgi:hypothetical protein
MKHFKKDMKSKFSFFRFVKLIIYIILYIFILINPNLVFSQIVKISEKELYKKSQSPVLKTRCIDTMFELNQISILTTYYNNENLHQSVASEEILFDSKNNAFIKECREIYLYTPDGLLREVQSTCNLSNSKTINYSNIYHYSKSSNFDTIIEFNLVQNKIINTKRKITIWGNVSMDTITIFEKFDSIWQPDRKEIKYFDRLNNKKIKMDFRFNNKQDWTLVSLKSFIYNKLNMCTEIEQKIASSAVDSLAPFKKEFITYDTFNNKIQTESYSFDTELCIVPEVKSTYFYNSSHDHLVSIRGYQWNSSLFQWAPSAFVEISYNVENNRMHTYKEYVFDENNKDVLSRSIRYEYFTD